ncbi:hypothetical protein F5Y03DRAFT_391611 [Xylaria venustula]|nr:hypothetical protein F5Y03DRAFT_391611 [Xylaria venustula]
MLSFVSRCVGSDTAFEKQSDAEKVAQMNAAVREVKACYEAGAPLFRREDMQKLGDLNALLEKGATSKCNIILKGINGVNYPLELMDLHVCRGDGHIGGSRWNIGYDSIQNLTRFENIDRFHASSAFCSMSVARCTWGLEVYSDTVPPAPSTEELLGVYEQRLYHFRESKYIEVLRAALQKMRTRHVINKFDPAYTELDRDVLTSYGYTVVEDPQGFLMLDDNSVLVSIGPDVLVKQIVADICRPAIIIRTKENFKYEYTDYSFPSVIYMTDPSSSRVDKMLKEEYVELEFPSHKSWSGLAMYVKKSIWID